MKRLLAKASGLFILGIFAGSFIATPPVTVDTETQALTQIQSAYPYLQAVSENQIATPNTTKILVSEESINARFVGMLSHIKWLISGDAVEDEDNEIVRLNKQILSLMDDIGEDRREDSDDDDDDEGSALTAGPDGYILISNGGSTNWVATSSLGLTASATPLSNDDVTPDFVASAGQVDEYCLTYEMTGNTWEWQTCGSGSSSFATSSIDTSLKLANIITDETGTGALVFAGSPTLSGTLTAAAANFSGNVGIGTTSPSELLSIGGRAVFDSSIRAGVMADGRYSHFGGTSTIFNPVQGNGTDVGLFVNVSSVATSAHRRAVYGIAEWNSPTNATGRITGVSGRALATGAGNLTYASQGGAVVGGSFYAMANGTTAANITRASGVFGQVNIVGSTTATEASSLYAAHPQLDTTITDFAGLRVQGSITGVGVVSNRYGVYIEDLVNGTNRYGIYQAGTSDSNYFAGNTGIGTTSPNARLTVHGDINVSQGSGVIQFGGTRFLYASTTNDSIVFGELAGNAFTSATTFNIAFGYEAGRNMSNANADYMTLVGYQAGYSNTGNNTSIIGFGAGYSNSGDYSAIMGPSAGLANTGDYNNLIGAFAGRNNTGGFNNFIGHSVGFQNTGNYNNVVGYYAGYNNTGSNNDMMGYQAGRYLLASSSVVIGAEALYGSHATNFVAPNNVAIGYRAGYTADDGASANILIGYQAADNLTTGNNNIIIGYNIDAVSATADNRLNIGNLIFGTGLDGTGTTLSSGNVGIGTSDPTSKLSINGGDLLVRDDGTSGSWAEVTVIGGSTGGGALYMEDAGKAGIVYANGTDTLYFTNNYSLYMTLDSAGNVGIGTTTPAQRLQVFGNIRVGTTGSNGCLEDFGGGLISGTCSSDEDLKEGIEPIEQPGRSYLESLAALTPVTYNWNEEAAELYRKDMTAENLGLIAQDVEAEFPELVSLNDEGYRQVDFRAFPFYIIQALKEVWEKLQGYDERLEELEEENEYLKNRLETIEDELDVSPPPPTLPEEVIEEPAEEPVVEEVAPEAPVVLVPAESI